jgi:hypothetical protein
MAGAQILTAEDGAVCLFEFGANPAEEQVKASTHLSRKRQFSRLPPAGSLQACSDAPVVR